MMITFRYKIKKSGFTLIESLTAITILLIGVMGPLVLATRNISDGISIKNEVAANYLVLEALEAVQAKRAINAFGPTSKDWRHELIATQGRDCSAVNVGCSIFDGLDNTITVNVCSGTSCDLQFDVSNSNRQYVLASTIGSGNARGPIFTRRVYIDEVEPNQELKVRVAVNWNEKGVNKNRELTSYLYYVGQH